MEYKLHSVELCNGGLLLDGEEIRGLVSYELKKLGVGYPIELTLKIEVSDQSQPKLSVNKHVIEVKQGQQWEVNTQDTKGKGEGPVTIMIIEHSPRDS